MMVISDTSYGTKVSVSSEWQLKRRKIIQLIFASTVTSNLCHARQLHQTFNLCYALQLLQTCNLCHARQLHQTCNDLVNRRNTCCYIDLVTTTLIHVAGLMMFYYDIWYVCHIILSIYLFITLWTSAWTK